MVKRILCCLLVVGFLVAVAGTSEAALMTIDFEAGPYGAQPNGFSAVGHPGVTFTDTIGSDLVVNSYYECNDTNCLTTWYDDASQLQIDFASDINYLSLDFGNDNPGFIVPGDFAWLQIYNDGAFVGSSQVAPNINDLMDQTIVFSGATFDQAFFYYGDAAGNAIDLIEAVDNITYGAVPEPATMLLFGTGLIGLAGLRRKFRK